MNIEQMKEQMEGAAQKRAVQLEREKRRLEAVIRKKENIIKEKNRSLRALYNRCHAGNAPAMCFFCGLKRECERLRKEGHT